MAKDSYDYGSNTKLYMYLTYSEIFFKISFCNKAKQFTSTNFVDDNVVLQCQDDGHV